MVCPYTAALNSHTTFQLSLYLAKGAPPAERVRAPAPSMPQTEPEQTGEIEKLSSPKSVQNCVKTIASLSHQRWQCRALRNRVRDAQLRARSSAIPICPALLAEL
jgi:hypothetical protein